MFQLVPRRVQKEIGLATGLPGSAGGLAGFLLPSALGILKGMTGNPAAGFFCRSLAAACGPAPLSQLRAPEPAPIAPEAGLAKAESRGRLVAEDLL